MLPFNAHVEYSWMRQRTMLNKPQRELPRLDVGRRLLWLRDSVNRAVEQFWNWYERQGNLCARLDPACELG
jgi:hypothetical protein